MRGSLLTCFLLLSIIARPQTPENLIFFSGYVFNEDSLPVENAALINFITLKTFMTNSKGYFQIFLNESDSLLINHISYERTIIKPNNHPSASNKFYLKASMNEIKTVTINYREQINLENNMQDMHIAMRKSTPIYNTNTSFNSFAPPRNDNVIGIDIVKLYHWIKNRRYRKGKEEEK